MTNILQGTVSQSNPIVPTQANGINFSNSKLNQGEGVSTKIYNIHNRIMGDIKQSIQNEKIPPIWKEASIKVLNDECLQLLYNTIKCIHSSPAKTVKEAENVIMTGINYAEHLMLEAQIEDKHPPKSSEDAAFSALFAKHMVKYLNSIKTEASSVAEIALSHSVYINGKQK